MIEDDSVEEYLNSLKNQFREERFEISELSEEIISYHRSLMQITETKPTMYSWGRMKINFGKEEHYEDY